VRHPFTVGQEILDLGNRSPGKLSQTLLGWEIQNFPHKSIAGSGKDIGREGKYCSALGISMAGWSSIAVQSQMGHHIMLGLV
jgi:hypothetical protein